MGLMCSAFLAKHFVYKDPLLDGLVEPREGLRIFFDNKNNTVKSILYNFWDWHSIFYVAPCLLEPLAWLKAKATRIN